MTRTETDHAGQAKAVATAAARVLAQSAALQTAVAALLEVVANPVQMVLIDSPYQEKIWNEFEKMRKKKEETVEQRATPPARYGVPRMEPVVQHLQELARIHPPAPTTPHGRVQEVLAANNIPFQYIEETNDYVLTDHVVTPDLLEFVRGELGPEGWTVSGQVAGPPADLRKRPDLFRKPSPQQQAEQPPAAFDGTYPNPRTEVRVVDKVPNAGEQ